MTRAALTLCVVLNIFTVTLFIEECNGSNSSEVATNDDPSSKCIPGKRQSDSEDYITTTEFIRRNGYAAEEHTVVTEDGYILTLHRIPPRKPNALPVLVQHGVLCSSFDFVVAGKDHALGFLLADGGYDVWLGNVRGNTYSRCHTRYTTSDYEFWDFSFHEMGIYDLPAMITYVTDVAGQRLVYIGHSMGTTIFFVMASERQDVAAKVRAMFSLSTVAYMGRMRGALRALGPIESELEYYPTIFGTYEFWPQSLLIKNFLKYFCLPTRIQRDMCTFAIYLVFGRSPFESSMLKSIMPEVLTNMPAGLSFKVSLHYVQELKSGKFRRYDYGAEENLKRYGSEEPPSYDISKIAVPIGVFWAPNDYMSHPLDLLKFQKQLPNRLLFKHKIEAPLWNHVDYMWGKDVRREVNARVLAEIGRLAAR